MNQTKEFMLLFRFNPANMGTPSPEAAAASQQQWGGFIGNLALQEKLVNTQRFDFNGQCITADQSIHEGANMTGGEAVSGYMVVKANTYGEATSIGQECPILQMGGSVEVREIVPM